MVDGEVVGPVWVVNESDDQLERIVSADLVASLTHRRSASRTLRGLGAPYVEEVMYDVWVRRTNIYLPDPQLEALRRVARQRGTSVASLVREVLAQWLEEQGVRPVETDEWEQRFDDLLARRARVAGKRGFTERDVDRDVSEAIREARAARRR